MITEAISKILAISENKTYEIDGFTYSDKDLVRIKTPIYRPSHINLSSLDSLVKMLEVEVSAVSENLPVFVTVDGYNSVSAYTTYGQEFKRDNMYCVTSDVPHFEFGWKEYDEAMIALRSQFAQDDEVAYIIDLLAHISDEDSVKNEDNGLAQSVEVRKGIALREKTSIRPHVTLRPYRTFLEIEQPASMFLLRLREGGQVGLIEADGGMWKLAARRTVASYLSNALRGLIAEGKVIVTI